MTASTQRHAPTKQRAQSSLQLWDSNTALHQQAAPTFCTMQLWTYGGGGKKKEVNEELPQQLLPPRNMTYIGSPSRRAIVLHSEWSAKSHHWALQDAGDFAGSAVPYCLVLPPERAPISKKQNWRWALSSMMTELLLGPGPVGQHIKTQGFFHLFVILFVFKHAPLLPHFTNSWTLMNSKHFEARSLKHFAINGTKAHVKTHWDSNGMLCD